MKEISSNNVSYSFFQKIKDYGLLFKFKLSLLVVFSAGITYIIAAKDSLNFIDTLLFCLFGFLITGAANSLNQVLEREYDRLMTRTANRPLATERMSVSEAVLLAGISSVIGILGLAIFFNQLSGVLGAVSLISYAFVYTPMKRVSPAATWIGAVPGALPILIGWTAATGNLSGNAWFLFAIQFFWQFPHFWAIAWVSFDDYSKAGFYLLPSNEIDGRNRSTALQCMVYALVLIPNSFLGYYYEYSVLAIAVTVLAAIFYSYMAFLLYTNLDKNAAKKLMFASFIYLPIVQMTLLLDSIL